MDYLAGSTQQELAERLGVCAEQVRLVFMRAGLKKRTRREIDAAMTERPALQAQQVANQVRDEAVATYREIGFLKETAEAAGVGYDLVRRVLSEDAAPGHSLLPLDAEATLDSVAWPGQFT